MDKKRILLLVADRRFESSLADFLRLEGIEMMVPAPSASPATPQVDLVIAACDSWPEPWTLPMLQARFRSVPCLLLSGSPVSGPNAATGFKRGYFLTLPANGRLIATQVKALMR